MDFINKLTGHDDVEKKAEPTEPTVAAPAPEPERHHNFFGGDDKEEEKKPELDAARPPPEPSSKRSSFIDKLTGRHDEEPEPTIAKPPPVPAKEQSFLGKLKDQLDGDDEPVIVAKPPTPPPKEESLGDKIGKFFGHEPEKTLEEREAELRQREEELKRREEVLRRQKEAEEHPHLTQIMEGLNLREKTPEPEKKEEGLGAKINAAFGGGHAAETEEDHLDKAIDFVQEHILKKGDQSHESFLEQMKDEQIASVVRKQYKERTGHEFPLKEPKKE